MTYLIAKDLDEAFNALEKLDAAPIAGGTDWFPLQGERITGRSLLDVTRLPGFRGVSHTGAGWRIGAATRWSDILRADLPPAFDALKLAAREVGSVQIQNSGTIAGNLCNASPAADGVPPLLMLDASVELASRSGTRVLPLGEFITGVRRTALRRGELVSAILAPPQPQDLTSTFLKAGARKYLVISIAMVAVAASMRGGKISEARIAVGSCSPVAQRLHALEAELAGVPVAGPLPQITPAHLSVLSPISDVRGSGQYRSEAVAQMVNRALCEVLAKAAS
jgi:CO/xanthine dehydrogenase FAD-binding subunit